jgi:2-polyprenyl-6-methoxyphenol hydroxylase-like FAD-dependent oxidoreductase
VPTHLTPLQRAVEGAHVHSPMGGQGPNSSIQDSVGSIFPHGTVMCGNLNLTVQVNLAWKVFLVVKKLSPRSLLSTYETERMPSITEMLKLMANLHTQSMSDRGMASKDASKSVNPGFVQEHIFKQLEVNYQ